jgi:hypothetical protein
MGEQVTIELLTELVASIPKCAGPIIVSEVVMNYLLTHCPRAADRCIVANRDMLDYSEDS